MSTKQQQILPDRYADPSDIDKIKTGQSALYYMSVFIAGMTINRFAKGFEKQAGACVALNTESKFLYATVPLFCMALSAMILNDINKTQKLFKYLADKKTDVRPTDISKKQDNWPCKLIKTVISATTHAYTATAGYLFCAAADGIASDKGVCTDLSPQKRTLLMTAALGSLALAAYCHYKYNSLGHSARVIASGSDDQLVRNL